MPSVDKNNQEFKHQILNLVAGAGSGAITKTAVAPLERIKILNQLQDSSKPKVYNGIIGTGLTVVREHGVRALYNGNGANVARVVPVYALKFAFNDFFKQIVAKPGQENLDFSQLILAGSAAGLFQSTITYPLDNIRTRMTMSEKSGVKFKGITDCARRTIAAEGVGGLYKGFIATLWSAAPYVGLQMTFYDLAKQMTADKDGKHSIPVNISCGAVAGVCAQTITYPGDTVRRRMQIQGIEGAKAEYTGTIDCVKKVFMREGWKGFYNGWVANTVRAVPGASIQFFSYDALKKVLYTAA